MGPDGVPGLHLTHPDSSGESNASVGPCVLNASEVTLKDEPEEAAARAEAKSPGSTQGTEIHVGHTAVTWTNLQVLVNTEAWV